MRILEGHSWAIRAVAFHPTEPTLLASVGDDRILRIWDTAKGECVHETRGIRGGGLALQFTRDGQFLITGDRDGTMIGWSHDQKWHPAHSYRSRTPSGPIGDLAVLPNRVVLASYNYLLANNSRGLLSEWHVDESNENQEYPWQTMVTSLSGSLDGRRVALAGEDRSVSIWELASFGEPASSYFPNTVRCVRYSPTEPTTLALAWGGNVEIIDDGDFETKTMCRGHRSLVQTLDFSQDGRLLLSGAADRTVRLWEVATGKELAAFDWGIGSILSVAIAPDGMTAVAGGTKRDLVLWDLE